MERFVNYISVFVTLSAAVRSLPCQSSATTTTGPRRPSPFSAASHPSQLISACEDLLTTGRVKEVDPVTIPVAAAAAAAYRSTQETTGASLCVVKPPVPSAVDSTAEVRGATSGADSASATADCSDSSLGAHDVTSPGSLSDIDVRLEGLNR